MLETEREKNFRETIGISVKTIGIHPRVDLDIWGCIWLLLEYCKLKLEEISFWFLSGGDESLSSALFKFKNFIFLDRGRGQFDHHGKGSDETSSALVAAKLKVTEEKEIRPLLRLIQRSDLQGISSPLDISDISKCTQRNKSLTDEDRIKIGVRVIGDVTAFRRKALARDNEWARKIIAGFVSKKEIVSTKIQGYLHNLQKDGFERPFDFVEIVVSEKKRLGEKTAQEFGEQILELVYQDSVEFFEAKREVRKAAKVNIKGEIIIFGRSDNPRFNAAARSEKALIVIQRDSKGHTHIFFDSKRITEKLVESIVSMVRLEELSIQGREIPTVNFRKTEKIEQVPEWYYYRAPQIGRKKPGYFLLNGSLTAPDTPISQIPLEVLLYIACSAIKFHPRFNWRKWKNQRITLYKSKQKTGDA